MAQSQLGDDHLKKMSSARWVLHLKQLLRITNRVFGFSIAFEHHRLELFNIGFEMAGG